MNDSNVIPINILPRAQKEERTFILLGHKHAVTPDTLMQDTHGLCESVVFTDKAGYLMPANTNSKTIFIWDTECELEPGDLEIAGANNQPVVYASAEQLKTNRFTLSDNNMHQPEIIREDSVQQLTSKVDFNFVYTPDQFAASLGMITLVNSKCFLTLKNGETRNLIDTGDESVLYLDENHPAEIITPILETTKSRQAIEKHFSLNLNVKLNNTTHDSDYETLALFEQYTSYILQRATPFSENNIWTPACAPISWGWSMRTGFRPDGDACIIRQKLLPPTLSHEEHEMPCWQNNNLALLETV